MADIHEAVEVIGNAMGRELARIRNDRCDYANNYSGNSGSLATIVQSDEPPDKRPTKTWTRTGPLGDTPKHVTDAYPLSAHFNDPAKLTYRRSFTPKWYLPMPSKKYRFHPACTVFPQLGESELNDLAADINANGLRNSIVLLQGKILDGRNRYLACQIADVQPRFVEYEGDDPIGWVVSQNLVRRHLTASQRAVVAHDLLPLLEKEAKERQRVAPSGAKQNGKAAEFAAKAVGSSTRYVERVKAISKKSPELVDRIRSGEVTVMDAHRQVTEPSYWHDRIETDDNPLKHYPTPQYVTEALLEREEFVGSIIEPACGVGAMSDVIRDWGYRVRSTDITGGHDFFRRKTMVENIITNPPYAKSSAEQFVIHAMKIAKRKIAMLLPLYFLEGVQRNDLFTHDEWPVKAIYIFSRRILFGGDTYGSPYGNIWIVWDKKWKEQTQVQWVLSESAREVG